MNQSQNKLEQLEGLRGVAAFVVLIHHLRMTFFVNLDDLFAARFGREATVFMEALFDGNFAVWLFWVMSAFVLSLRFHASTDESALNSMLTDATVRRYPRLLLPVLLSVLFAWGLHHCGLMSNVKLAELLGEDYDDWLAKLYLFEPNLNQALYSGFWQTFFDYNTEHSYNGVLWTMEVELYGSYFLFAFLALFGKYPARILIYAATFLILNQLVLHWLNAFVLGTIVCDLYINRSEIRQQAPVFWQRLFDVVFQSRWVAVVLILPMIYLIGLPNQGEVLHLLLAVALTAYVVVSDSAKRLFSNRILVFLGKISFGLYLAHMPIICAAAFPLYIGFLGFFSPLYSSCLASLLLITISLVAGWIFWYVADRPAVAFSRYVANSIRNGMKLK